MSMLTPVAVAERTVRRFKPSDGQPSQRDLVALSLLLCPDGHAPRDPR
jgi:hypothetical protein